MGKIVFKFVLNLKLFLVRSNVLTHDDPTKIYFYGIMMLIYFISHLEAQTIGSQVKW